MAIVSKLYSLKYPHFVQEEEFFKYLKKVCKNKRIRGYITDYYQTLVDYDKENGLTITKDSFGESIFKNPKTKEKEELDIVKHIFSEKQQIGMADFFRYQFCNNLSKVKYINSNAREFAHTMSSGTMFSSIGSISAREEVPILQPTLKIFKVDNRSFITKVEIEIFVDSLNLSTRQKFKLVKQTFKEFVTREEKRVVFHECSHLLSRKTACNGRLTQTTAHRFVDVMKQTPHSDIKLSVKGKVKDKITGSCVLSSCYSSGRMILDEICTEKVARPSIDWISLTNFNQYSCSPTNQMYGHNLMFGKNIQKRGFYGYLPFNVIVEGLKTAGCINSPQEFLLNPDNLDNFFKDGAMSPSLKQYACQKLEHLLDKNESFEKTTDYEIFLMTLGKGYKDYMSSFNKSNLLFDPSQKDDYSFNSSVQLAQAMIIDVHTNTLKAKFEELEKCENKESMKTLLAEEIAKAEKFDDYVIKPNDQMFVEGQEVFERNVLSNAELAQRHPEVVSLAMWSKHLNLVNDLSKQYQMLLGQDKSILLQKEENFLKNKSDMQNLSKNAEFVRH